MRKFLFLLFSVFISGYSQNLQQIRKDIRTLASKEFAGRAYNEEGHRKAAEYIRKRFREAGLKSPITENYFQKFPIKVYVFSSATLTWDKKEQSVGSDFIPHAASAAKCFEGKYVYLEYGYPKNYKKKVRNKIVVFKDGQGDNKEKLSLSEKIKLAAKHGAAGVVILQKKPVHSILSEKYGKEFSIPVLRVFEDSVLVRKKGKISLCVQAKWKEVFTQNVIGYVQGKTDTVILIGAHYDHLGKIDTAVFYGANDNASGTSLLLALADTLAKLSPKYTIVFIAFGAEEAGLLGSHYYVMHPVFPLEKTKRVINLDLWGYGKEGAVAVAGKEYTEFFREIRKLAEEENFPLTERENRPNSDHYFFTLKNVPALFFYARGGQFYHDIWDRYETLSLEGIPEMYRILVKFSGN